MLSGDRNGLYTHGGRKGYNTNIPNYLDACARIVDALARHYGRHPGVIGWQLDNEPGFPFEAYDPVSERAFQAWLKARYGTLDVLNRAWNGASWGHAGGCTRRPHRGFHGWNGAIEAPVLDTVMGSLAPS